MNKFLPLECLQVAIPPLAGQQWSFKIVKQPKSSSDQKQQAPSDVSEVCIEQKLKKNNHAMYSKNFL